MSPNDVPAFAFVGFFVERVNFVTLPQASTEPGESRPKFPSYALRLNVGVGVQPTNLRAQVTLTVGVEPDPKWHPYQIEVVVTGRFQGVEGETTTEQLEAFCRINAPVILFPYVREIVHRLTVDGMYGLVRLNPVNMQALLAESAWEPVKADATDSELPSEQSPSALPETEPQP